MLIVKERPLPGAGVATELEAHHVASPVGPPEDDEVEDEVDVPVEVEVEADPVDPPTPPDDVLVEVDEPGSPLLVEPFGLPVDVEVEDAPVPSVELSPLL
jgi:hypothetical protein